MTSHRARLEKDVHVQKNAIGNTEEARRIPKKKWFDQVRDQPYYGLALHRSMDCG